MGTKINSNFSQKIPSPCRQHPQLSTTLNPQNTNTHTNSKPTAQRLGPPPYRQTPTNSALAAIQRSADGSPPTIQPLYRHEQPGRQAKRPPPARTCSCPVSRPSLPPPTKKEPPGTHPGNSLNHSNSIIQHAAETSESPSHWKPSRSQHQDS